MRSLSSLTFGPVCLYLAGSQFVAAVVEFIVRMPLDLVPADIVGVRQIEQALPQIPVLDGLAIGFEPIALHPIAQPVFFNYFFCSILCFALSLSFSASFSLFMPICQFNLFETSCSIFCLWIFHVFVALCSSIPDDFFWLIIKFTDSMFYWG